MSSQLVQHLRRWEERANPHHLREVSRLHLVREELVDFGTQALEVLGVDEKIVEEDAECGRCRVGPCNDGERAIRKNGGHGGFDRLETCFVGLYETLRQQEQNRKVK